MEWLIIIPVCLLGGWWLFSTLLGNTEAKQAINASPARGCAGIAFFAIIVFVGLLVLGLLTGG